MIILQFDGVYAPWGLLMLRSLALHEPDKTVLVDVVNLDPEQRSEMERAHPRLIVRWEAWETTSPERMANRKCFVLQRAMDEHPEELWYCLMDADFLVRRPLPNLWDLMHRADAGLFMTDGVWEGRVYQHLMTPSGILLVRSSARRLVDRWAAWNSQETAIAGIRPGAWFWDQVTLLKAREETPLRYAVIPLDEFADCGFHPHTAIWSAHVAPEDKEGCYPLFLKEHERQAAESSL
jgi:hypothetical protein